MSYLAANVCKDGSTQTKLCYPRHAVTQYEPRYFSAQEIEQQLVSQSFQTFFRVASLRLERVLVENCLFNPFKDATNDSPLKINCLETRKTNRVARRLMYYGELCEGKFVSAIHCHPLIPGIIVAGYAEKVQLEYRLMHKNSTQRKRNFALVWNFSKLTEPVLLLESPDDIIEVRFHPQQPFLIVASCHSGMILVWSIGPYQLLLRNTDRSSAQKDGAAECLSLVPVAATLNNFPSTSKRLHWVPSEVEFSSKGASAAGISKSSAQLYACYEGTIIVWEFKIPNRSTKTSDSIYLPNRIKSVFKLYPVVSDKRRDLAISCFAMVESSESQVSNIYLKSTYPPICIAGTDEGEIFMLDLRTYSETERGATSPAIFCRAYHDGPVGDILAAPFLTGTALSIGGKMWALWKTLELDGPVLEMNPRSSTIVSACWSPWQPSVIAIGLSNGLVEVWDFLSSTTSPQHHFQISKTAISVITFCRNRDGFFLAIGDVDGVGKVTFIPFPIDKIKPDEEQVTQAEDFIQVEYKHRYSLAQQSKSAASPARIQHQVGTEVTKEEDFQITKEEYFSAFLDLEKSIVQGIQK